MARSAKQQNNEQYYVCRSSVRHRPHAAWPPGKQPSTCLAPRPHGLAWGRGLRDGQARLQRQQPWPWQHVSGLSLPAGFCGHQSPPPALQGRTRLQASDNRVNKCVPHPGIRAFLRIIAVRQHQASIFGGFMSNGLLLVGMPYSHTHYWEKRMPCSACAHAPTRSIVHAAPSPGPVWLALPSLPAHTTSPPRTCQGGVEDDNRPAVAEGPRQQPPKQGTHALPSHDVATCGHRAAVLRLCCTVWEGLQAAQGDLRAGQQGQ
jgi:hypothetical protein